MLVGCADLGTLVVAGLLLCSLVVTSLDFASFLL